MVFDIARDHFAKQVMILVANVNLDSEKDSKRTEDCASASFIRSGVSQQDKILLIENIPGPKLEDIKSEKI